MLKKKDIIIAGFALFAMLFGAGNLIFPAKVGYINGNLWYEGAIGFILTGTGFPLLAIFTSALANKDLSNFAERVSPLFSKLFGIVLILAIGPLLALPRTGATSFEIIFPSTMANYDLYKYIFIFIFFGISLLFSLKSSKVVDRIGAILTPILLIVLATIIVKGIIAPPVAPIDMKLPENFSPFRYGFENAYQTMDTLAAIVFSTIILKALRNGHELTKKQETSLLIQTSLIAIGGLVIVYGGLCYIGATVDINKFIVDIKEIDLLRESVKGLLGNVGINILAICVLGACLTTAIGLTATVGDYFNTLTGISYQVIVVITTIISIIFALFGVNTIIKISVPALVFLYPVAISLIFLNLFDKKIKSDITFKMGVFGAGIGGVCNVIEQFGHKIEIYDNLPLANYGLAWLTPFFICLIIGIIISKIKNNK